ncbi:MAG TPA: polymorphic toxin-type HINT domain-containing protein, partial [Kofleriaceae bacterium]|nr:polymorphic toxin-type HINT domain-containing protein [Kofleriaceae bacterium]
CNQQGAANWIRVTDPADATVEDVAREMYGEDTMAWKITPAAPLFGLEPMGLKPEHYRVLSANGGGTSSERPGGGPQTLPQQLLTGPLADEAALGQAKGFAPGPADAGALTQQFDQIVVHFGDLQQKLGPIGEETDKLAGARQRVVDRKQRITGGNAGEIGAWSGQAREQLDVLIKCIDGVNHADRVHAAVKDQPQGQFEARLLRDHIARRYSRAASISDMVVTARGMLGVCERATQTFVVDWLDDVFRWLRGAIINSRTNRRSGGAQDPSLAVPDLDRRETEIRNELQALRELMLTNPEAAQPRIQAIYQKLNDLSLEVALVRNVDACDEAWSNLKAGRSTMGWIRGLAPGDHGNERLENLQGEANEFDAAWRKMLDDWRAGKRKEATDALEALSKQEKWKSFFDRVAREIKDQAEYDRLMIFLAMIGIAVVSAGAGMLAAGAVGGGLLGFAVGLTTEVTVFTSLSWALIDKEHTLSGFWSQWKQNFGIFLVLRGISGAFKLAGASGGLAEVATQYAAINGIALYERNQAKVKEGKGALSAGEILETSLENLMFLVGVSIAQTLVSPWMSRLALRGEIGRRIGEVEGLNQRVTELARRVESTKGKDRAAAQQLLDKQAELLDKQGKVLEDLLRYADNPGAARDAGITEAQLRQIQEQRGKLDDSRRQVALTRLFASLEPVSSSSYLIARDGSIVRARADFEAQVGHDPAGAQPNEGIKSVSEIATDGQTQSRSFTVEMKDGSSFRIAEKIGDGRMEQGSRPLAAGPADAAPLGDQCFVAGTLVATPDGAIAIEAVRPGQVVLTRDLAAGRMVSATVLGCMASEAPRILEIEVAGALIRCTPGHPFWIAGHGWATASDLRPGTALVTADGGAVVVA